MNIVNRCLDCPNTAHQSCIGSCESSISNGGWKCGMCNGKDLKSDSKCLICRSRQDPFVRLKVVQSNQMSNQKGDVSSSNGGQTDFDKWAHLHCIQGNLNIIYQACGEQYQTMQNYVQDLDSRSVNQHKKCLSCNKKKGDLIQCAVCQIICAHRRCIQQSLNFGGSFNIQGGQIQLFTCTNCASTEAQLVLQDCDPSHQHSNQGIQQDLMTYHSNSNFPNNIANEEQALMRHNSNDRIDANQYQNEPIEDQKNYKKDSEMGQEQQLNRNDDSIMVDNQSSESLMKEVQLGKRIKREAGKDNQDIISQDRQSSGSDTSGINNDIESCQSTKRQRTSDDDKSKNKNRTKQLKSTESFLSSLKAQQQVQGDPFQFLLKEVMTPIIFQIDKLQVLKRDKQLFQINLMKRDLKMLPKERKEEILSSKIFLDQSQNQDEFLLTINLKQNDSDNEQLIRDSSDNQSNDVLRASNQEDDINVDELTNTESKSPDVVMNLDDESQENQRGSNSIEGSPTLNPDNIEFQKPKKKRRKAPLTMPSKKYGISKNLINLPSNLSDFSWIENTDQNIFLLEEEKTKQSEVRKQKEELKRQQSDVKSTELTEITDGQQMEIDTKEEKPAAIEEVKEQKIDLIKEAIYDFQDPAEIKSFDDIYEKVDQAYYHSLDSLIYDIEFLIKKTIRSRCQDSLSKRYLTNVLGKCIQLIRSKAAEFKQKWRSYYENKFSYNETCYPKVQSGWWKSPGAKREYNLIEDYKILTPQDNNHQKSDAQAYEEHKNEISKKMKTQKIAKCDGNCCNQIEQLGPFKLNNDVWSTQCECRFKKVECSENCGCDPVNCQNRQMQLKQSLKLTVDVVEKISWGIDMCTAVNIMSLLPRNVPQKIQSDFVENRLVFAVQSQGDNGYDIREALKFIVEKIDHPRFREVDRYFAKIVLGGIKNCKGQNEKNFRVHSKGIGIFCNRKEGIKANNLVIEYYGEIYQPWYWYEKQDVLKQGQNKSQLSKELPEFYNITYERHQDDPQGYDILMVDPILYGNYSSRLSHSCNPNCSTIIQARNKEYSIGMFAIKDVSFGEELSFNYCSLTESEKEYEAAVCLCASEFCQGRYLQLANDKKHQTLLKKYHTFVDRNYIIWKAIKFPDITEEDIIRLNEFGLKESVMATAPDWLKKWASLLCEYILFEEQEYPKVLKLDFPHLSESDLKIDAKGLRDSKLWNVAITIDKVMHVLKSMGTMEPPIKDLSFKERYKRLWENDGSLKSSLQYVLEILEESPERNLALNQINQNSQSDKVAIFSDENEEEKYFEKQFDDVRSILAQISDSLRSVKSRKITIQALCDMLWLYANTQTYFTPNDKYKKFTGDEVRIRKCDVKSENQSHGSLNTADQEKTVYKGKKEYDPGYIWGQLVGWFKQTVDKPNASLSADRRGTLSMPDLESFIANVKNQGDQKSGIKRKKKRKGGDEFEDEEIQLKHSGTRSRPVTASNKRTSHQSSEGDSIIDTDLKEELKQGQNNISTSSGKDLKVCYPHKKHQNRDAFLENWGDNFSKQWDVCCKWNFKNKQRMYGSVQFESVLRADLDRARRLDSFKTVVNHLTRQN